MIIVDLHRWSKSKHYIGLAGTNGQLTAGSHKWHKLSWKQHIYISMLNDEVCPCLKRQIPSIRGTAWQKMEIACDKLYIWTPNILVAFALVHRGKHPTATQPRNNRNRLSAVHCTKVQYTPPSKGCCITRNTSAMLEANRYPIGNIIWHQTYIWCKLSGIFLRGPT